MKKKLLRRSAPTTAVVCLLVSCGGAPGETIADTADEARIAISKPVTEALLLIDDSCSMGTFHNYLVCPQYGAASPMPFTRMDVVKAGLLGCEQPSDGFLSRWRSDKLAMMRLSATSVVAGFDGNQAALEMAAHGLAPTGGTPLTTALLGAGAYVGGYFTDANARGDAPYVVVLIADGQANGPGATFDIACDGSAVTVGGEDPARGAGYLATRDTICALAGEQRLRIHTVAVGGGPAAFIEQMKHIAKAGRGTFSTVANPTELSDHLLKIMLNP